MAIEVKIAPDLEEITRQGNVFECDFDDMHIKWAIAADCRDMSEKNETNLKQWLQSAIGMSGKRWQIAWLLNKNLPFKSEVYINGKKVEYKQNLHDNE
jgi:hypothetical protein